VVAREDHERVVRLTRLLEALEQLAELSVDVRDERVVRAA
jgi:hypothetical protein